MGRYQDNLLDVVKPEDQVAVNVNGKKELCVNARGLKAMLQHCPDRLKAKLLEDKLQREFPDLFKEKSRPRGGLKQKKLDRG